MDTPHHPDLPETILGKDSMRFDPQGGSILERLIFNNRPILLIGCLIITIFLGFSLRNLTLTASFESMLPVHQEFIQNYEHNQSNLKGLGNTLYIVVESKNGGILSRNYIKALGKLNDDVFLLEGVDRSFMRSLWTPNVQWFAITSQGVNSGPVMPTDFSGSGPDLAQLQNNINNAGIVGSLVAPDYKSSMIEVPLLETNPITGGRLDYRSLTIEIEALRKRFDAQGVTLHITGFAMIVGDLIQGMRQILGFFAVSVLISAGMVYWYTRCVTSTALVVFCSILAVSWQLGILPLLGFSLDPYSILVPFLVFAIGMSHGAQKMNGVMQDIGRGSTRLVAARLTFRRLFVAGFTALVCDAVGFAVLFTIKIQAIEELAIVASIGVVILIFTNLILLPVMLSYVGVSPTAAQRSLSGELIANAGAQKHLVWTLLDLFTQRKYAAIAIGASVAIAAGGVLAAQNLQIGDLDPGAPELRAHSTYNIDSRYFVEHYRNSSDVFVVMVKTPTDDCSKYKVLASMDALETQLRQLPGVISTSSFADAERMISVELNEGSLDWEDLLPNQASLNEGLGDVPPGMISQNCDFLNLSVFLKDHKASTLTNVVNTVQAFSAKQQGSQVQFLLAGGNAGIDAATNLVVARASHLMLFEVYAAVIILSLITFRSVPAVVIAILPLIFTSILAQALMVWLGIGVKVATLPVTALGVGIGVDYALYILSVTLANMRKGMDLSEAYYRALLFTGKVVMLTGFTLAAAVFTWAFSPIKFQADMGELLAFMFLWNMLGALVLLPALACFLLPRPKAS